MSGANLRLLTSLGRLPLKIWTQFSSLNDFQTVCMCVRALVNPHEHASLLPHHTTPTKRRKEWRGECCLEHLSGVDITESGFVSGHKKQGGQ